MRKRSIALVLAVFALMIGSVFGTFAWLTDRSDTVTNTFTASNITVELKETTGITYKMVPGCTITKDPKATVKADSEPCYLFVQLEKSTNFDTYLTYEMADGWTQLEDAQSREIAGVYYRKITTAEMGTSFSVLKDEQVKVKEEVTKQQMNELTSDTYPTLKVTASASQLMKDSDQEFTAIEAWNNLSASGSNGK